MNVVIFLVQVYDVRYMPRVSSLGYTPKQLAYARRVLDGGAHTRKDMALMSGYSQASAGNAGYLEKKMGFHNAMQKLALQSNMVVTALLEEFSNRNLRDFTDKDLIAATNVLTNSWAKFNKVNIETEMPKQQGPNRLRPVIMQHIENQTVNGEVKEVGIETNEENQSGT
jgi:hypothetical protein